MEIGDRMLRALVPLPYGAGNPSWGGLQESLDELAREHEVAIGLSEPRNGLEGGRLGLREASDASRIARALQAGRGRAVLHAARRLQVPGARAAG